MEKVIAEITKGKRTGANTDWPIRDQVVREQTASGKVQWFSVHGLCNGVPDSVRTHRTRADACAAIGVSPTKYADEYEIQGHYAHGWERVAAESTCKDAKQRLREYQENEGGAFRIFARKVKARGYEGAV